MLKYLRQYRNINCSRSKRSSGIAFLPRTSVYLLVLLLINLLWEPPIRCIIKHGILGTIIDYLHMRRLVCVCMPTYLSPHPSFLPSYLPSRCMLPSTHCNSSFTYVPSSAAVAYSYITVCAGYPPSQNHLCSGWNIHI